MQNKKEIQLFPVPQCGTLFDGSAKTKQDTKERIKEITDKIESGKLSP